MFNKEKFRGIMKGDSFIMPMRVGAQIKEKSAKTIMLQRLDKND